MHNKDYFTNMFLSYNRQDIQRHFHDRLFKNSIIILLSSILSAGFGFIFWMLAAKLYSAEDVGIAAALISSMWLLVLLSRFGLDVSIIRFFPANDKSRIFSTSAIITTILTVLFGAIFIAGVDVFSPELWFLKSSSIAIVYIIFLIMCSMTALTNISFIAIRKVEFQFIQNIVISFKILLLVPLITFGAFGVFSAVGISFILALIVSLIFHVRLGIKPRIVIDRDFLKYSFNFSAGNYIAGLLTTAHNYILPIMVLNILGPISAAHYYVAYAIASILFKIPSAFSASLFVEGSHGEALKKNTLKSLFAIFSLLIPAIIILYISGEFLLKSIGPIYVEGVNLFKVMILSSFFVAISSVYFSIKKVQKNIKGLVFLSFLIFVLIIGLSYIFMIKFGILGVGYAWLICYTLVSMIIVVMVKKEGWIKRW